VARAVEDADGDPGDGAVLGLGDPADVLATGAVMSMTSAAAGPVAILSM
jgi:hypothetical protein